MTSVIACLFCVLVVSVAVITVGDAYGVTVIDGTEITWSVVDYGGNSYDWVMNVTGYEDLIVESRYHVRDKINLYLDGETIRTINLDGFVKRAFVNVIDDVYDNSADDSYFIWNVWHIVSQLTVYDADVYEYSEGRYALETLTRGGGDCEDLTILIADMLMSSEHTADWTIQYVFMDADNPTDPQTMNHVILYVNDGEFDYYIESTGAPSWEYYPDGVNGWYFDVVEYTDELNFAGNDLRWMDLSGADLQWANLEGADLEWANLYGANLKDANLYGANLEGANLEGANLEGANLYGANLKDANLYGASLYGSDLGGADLEGANLYGANLQEVDLRGAYLVRAYLHQADLYGADLSYANLHEADLSRADLIRADLTGADLTGADLTASNLIITDLSWANLSGADLSWANLAEVILYGADLAGVDLQVSNLVNADIRWANLDRANLLGANLAWANLHGVDLAGVDLSGANLHGVTIP